ncbi:MAG: hypothetical protein D6761_12875 [Candidatus Dadabacteria bacterium]|nr:MAG: hypothetical protein D6761_12875 [Candidatus Dadabacteria bacterium]
MVCTVIDLTGSRAKLPDADVIGGKAAGIAAMARAGLPVPLAVALLDPEQANEETVAEVERLLGPGPWFVRSSFAVEDREQQSFAGQGLTLPHQERTTLLEAIRRVWDSWRSRRAQTYLERAGATTGRPAGSVVVQREAIPLWSGVLFTRAPDAIDRWARIEAGRGYGEGVVSGRIAPQAVEFHWFRDVTLHDPPDGVREALPRFRRLLPTLERIVGGPCDAEWVIDSSDRLWVLQARPATGTTPQLWSGTLGDEFWSGEVSPMMFSTVGRVIEDTMVREPLSVVTSRLPERLLRVYQGRIYVDVGSLSAALRLIPGWAVTDAVMEMFPPRIVERFRQEQQAWSPRVPGALLRAIPRFLRKRFPWWPGWQLRRASAQLERAERWNRRPVPGKLEQIHQEIGALLADLGWNLRITAWGMLYAYVLVPLSASLLEQAPEAREALFRRLPNDPVQELDDDLGAWCAAYAAVLREAESWPAFAAMVRGTPAGDAFDELLRRWGHRAEERDVSAPRWEERPEALWHMLRLRLDAPAVEGPEWRSAIRAARHNIGFARAFLALTVGALARAYLGYRERMRDIADRYLVALRRRLLALDSGDHDVFALELCDGTLREPERVEPVQGGERPPRFLIGDTPLAESADVADDALSGLPASPGVATGRVCWVRTLSDLDNFAVGDILFAEYLDPAFSLVLERSAGAAFISGGMLSHGAIIAREYGVPAVVGVRGLAEIENGAHVRIDAVHGVVERLS